MRFNLDDASSEAIKQVPSTAGLQTILTGNTSGEALNPRGCRSQTM